MNLGELLTLLLQTHAQAEPGDASQRLAALRQQLASSGVDLNQLRDHVIETFDGIHGANGEPTEESAAQLEALADIAEAVTEQIAHNLTQAQRASEAATRLSAARNPAPAAEPDPAAQGQPDAGTPAGGTRQAPDHPPTAGSADETRHLDNSPSTAEPAPSPQAQGAPPAPAAPQQSPAVGQVPPADPTTTPLQPAVTASTPSPTSTPPRGGQLVPLNQLASSHLPATTGNGRRITYTFNSAADVPGFPVGAELPDIKALAAALTARMRGLARVGLGRTAQAGVAAIHRNAPAELTYANENDWQVVDRACDEKALSGGNLIAAGGWCAPSETLYDMCPTAAVDGLVDLPEVVTRRGGIRFAKVPDFYQIYSGVGFHLTEQQIMGDPNAQPPVDPTLKPCWEIPCVELEECRLDVDGLCIKTPILTERGWPELVEYFMQQALAAHAHRINAWVLARMTELATPVTIQGPTGAAPNVVDPHGPGATASILSILELYVEHVKLRYRLAQGTTLEMVAPRWLRGILRADLSKRLGVDMINVTNATLDSYLALRGVRPQWVIDWQDAFGLTGTVSPSPPAAQPPPHGIIPPIGTGLGAADYPQKWPDQVKILLYPAGSLFRMSADVITLDGVYDAASLSKNEYTKLFTEEGIQVCNRCYEPVALTISLCPNGLTGAGVERLCAAPPAAQATQPELVEAAAAAPQLATAGASSNGGASPAPTQTGNQGKAGGKKN